MKRAIIIFIVAAFILSIFLNGRFIYNHYKIIRESKINEETTATIYKNILRARAKTLNDLHLDSSDVVFVGNSLTEGFPLTEMFHNINIKNRGISGNTISDVLDRITPIAQAHPRKMFIEIGINDLKNQIDNLEAAKSALLRDYAVLLDTTRKISPSTQIYVQSLLPVNSTYFHDKITAITPIIKEVNQALYDLCKERNCQYIDLYKSFAQSDLLPENYSPDGLHLKDEGYEIWFNKVKNAIN